jgi:4-amino-4-deoxy-L-arabinose transferase-like glycosyltransferase
MAIKKTAQAAAREKASPPPVPLTLIAFGILMLLIVIVRIRLAPTPLERDEGEYALAGQLILDGVPPYVQIANMKMPGIYAAYAVLLAVFGQSATGIHLGFMCMNLITVGLFYLAARRLFDQVSSLMAAGTFALMSLDLGVLGPFAHATQFVVLFVVIAGLFLPEPAGPLRVWTFFVTGLALGTAFMMKQHAAAFIVFGGLYVLYVLAKRKEIALATRLLLLSVYCGAVFIPYLAACAIHAWLGVFDKFWFWTYQYAKAYVSVVPMRQIPYELWRGLRTVADCSWPLWFLAIIGLVSIRRDRPRLAIVGGLFVAGAIGVSPGFFFRGHYFVLLLPALALLVAPGATAVAKLVTVTMSAEMKRIAPLVFVASAWVITIFGQFSVFFSMPPDTVSRMIYGFNPFPESPVIARYIAERTKPDEPIAVFGSEPQICFYAHRPPASPIVYMYPIMENQPFASDMQLKLINDVESKMPRYIVYANVYFSWLRRPDSPKHLDQWLPPFLEKNYRRVGLIELLLPSNYYWERDQIGRKAVTKDSVSIFVRKDP